MLSQPMYTTQRHAGRGGGQDGMSIVGLIVGLQLFSILALSAMPSMYRSLEMYRLRAGARELYADLQSARMGAVMANHRYRLSVIDGQTYQLHDDKNNNGVIDSGETVTTRSIQRDARGVTLSAASTIIFAGDGSAPAPGTLTLSSTNSTKTTTVTVVVSSAGRVRINFPVS